MFRLNTTTHPLSISYRNPRDSYRRRAVSLATWRNVERDPGLRRDDVGRGQHDVGGTMETEVKTAR